MAEADEVAWLIERDGLCLGFCNRKWAWITFTNESALRFSRHSDAVRFTEAMRDDLKLEDVLITEHMWVGGSMKVRGDIERVNLATGERWQRVTGDGESRLESTTAAPQDQRS